MITIVSMLEAGYKSTFEHLAFRQLKGAYGCNLVCIPHDHLTMSEALSRLSGERIFMVPPGRVNHSKEFSKHVFSGGDINFIFGSPQESLISYVGDHTALHITTPGPVDMMAVCVAALVLNVRR